MSNMVPTIELGSLFAVDHPRYAELIDKHAKPGGPEGLLDRHRHLPVFSQCVKYAFRICRIIDLERYGEAFWCFIALRRSVRPHQYLIAHDQAGVEDFVAPLRWHMFLHWRTRMGNHCFDFAAKALLI